MTTYIGNELEVFARAVNWKARLRGEIGPFLEAPVLEVGAGLGSTTAALRELVAGPWTGLEPDPELAAQMARRAELDSECVVGTLADLPPERVFRTLIYIDVLEHIEADRAELEAAQERLVEGGRLVVLSPAHQWLYSPFDRAIGHHRRYSRRTLLAVAPPELRLERCRYLDGPGMLLNLGNRLLARQADPKPAQILVWDRLFVPMARILDPILGYRVGRSLLAVWRRPGPADRN